MKRTSKRDTRERYQKLIEEKTRPARKASAPLQVMLEPEQKERYERLRDDLGLTSMRDLVVMALEALFADASERRQRVLLDATTVLKALGTKTNIDPIASTTTVPTPSLVVEGGLDVPWMMRTLMAQVERISRLEERVELLQEQMTKEHGLYIPREPDPNA